MSERAYCTNCGGMIHLETGDMGFGDITIWVHDGHRLMGFEDDPIPIGVR